MLLAALQRRAALKFPNFAINSSPPFLLFFAFLRPSAELTLRGPNTILVNHSRFFSRELGRNRSDLLDRAGSRKNEFFKKSPLARSSSKQLSNFCKDSTFTILSRSPRYTKPGQRHQTPNLHSSLSTPYEAPTTRSVFPPFLEIKTAGKGGRKGTENRTGRRRWRKRRPKPATRLSIHTAATIPRSRFYDREFHRIPGRDGMSTRVSGNNDK